MRVSFTFIISHDTKQSNSWRVQWLSQILKYSSKRLHSSCLSCWCLQVGNSYSRQSWHNSMRLRSQFVHQISQLSRAPDGSAVLHFLLTHVENLDPWRSSNQQLSTCNRRLWVQLLLRELDTCTTDFRIEWACFKPIISVRLYLSKSVRWLQSHQNVHTHILRAFLAQW